MQRGTKLLFGTALAIAPLAIGGAVAVIARARRAAEQPEYDVEDRIGRLEIRRYDAHVEAETLIEEADITTAIARGCNRLAAYIAGANEHHARLATTTPLTCQDVEGDTRVAFMMPSSLTSALLPEPIDDRIEIVEVPPRRVAVLTFRGPRSNKLINKKLAELCQLVERANLDVRGEPLYAGFDPSWTLPLLRRNEVWIELA